MGRWPSARRNRLTTPPPRRPGSRVSVVWKASARPDRGSRRGSRPGSWWSSPALRRPVPGRGAGAPPRRRSDPPGSQPCPRQHPDRLARLEGLHSHSHHGRVAVPPGAAGRDDHLSLGLGQVVDAPHPPLSLARPCGNDDRGAEVAGQASQPARHGREDPLVHPIALTEPPTDGSRRGLTLRCP